MIEDHEAHAIELLLSCCHLLGCITHVVAIKIDEGNLVLMH